MLTKSKMRKKNKIVKRKDKESTLMKMEKKSSRKKERGIKTRNLQSNF